MFRVLAAADLGQKVNVELAFPVVPTLPELIDKITAVMTQEALVKRPQVPGFAFHRAQVFDERMEMWVDLVASSQLEDYCQVYVFQKESQWHKETPGRIPSPTKPFGDTPNRTVHASRPAHTDDMHQLSIPRTVYGSEHHLRSDSPIAPPLTQPPPRGAKPPPPPNSFDAKVLRAYEEFDGNKARAVTLDDWLATFDRLRMVTHTCLTDETLKDLFAKADANRDRLVTPNEFSVFAEIYPKMVDCIFFRCGRLCHEALREQRMRAQYDILDDLEKKLDDVRQQTRDLEIAEMEARDACLQHQDTIDDARQREKESGDAKYDAGRQVEDIKKKLKEAKGEQSCARDAYRKVEQEKKAAERVTESVRKRLRQQEVERDRTAREVDRLRKMLEEQERELAKKEEAITQTMIEVDEAAAREEEVGDPELEARRDSADDEVRRVEEDLAMAQNHVKELERDHINAVSAINKASDEQRAAQQRQEAAAVKLSQQQAAEARAMAAVQKHKDIIDNVQEVEKKEDAKRDEEEAKENELVQMEVRLREQREAVEKREAALRDAHFDFSQETGRTNTAFH